MANSTIDSELFFLIDRWPAVPISTLVPQDFPTGAACGHNQAAALYQVGTKIQVKTKPTVLGVNGATTAALGQTGLSTFIYLKLEEDDNTYTLAAKAICAQHSDAGSGGDGIFDVTNDSGNDIGAQKGPIAIALSAMTEDYFGWFWCGGLCPEFWVPALGGNFNCLYQTLAIGDMTWNDTTTPAATVGDFGFDVANAVGETVIGHAMATYS